MLCERDTDGLSGVDVRVVFLSSVIAHLHASTCVLLISPLKSVENCLSREISFVVRGLNEGAQVCQMDCGKSGSRPRRQEDVDTIYSDTLQWRSDLGMTLDVAEQIVLVQWPATTTLQLRKHILLAWRMRCRWCWTDCIPLVANLGICVKARSAFAFVTSQ